MKSTFARNKEKNSGATDSSQKTKSSGKEAAGHPVGLPRFLHDSAAETVKQRVKITSRPGSEKSIEELEAGKAAEKLRHTNTDPEPDKFANPVAQNNEGKAGGTPLPESTRALMEEHFGRDFSSVRIHSDSAANQLADSFGANALTRKEDIYFNRDRYDPSSTEGRGLLAHELAHVTQQRGKTAGRVQFDLMATLPVTLGYFEIEMTARTTPRVGMEGYLRFFPDPNGPYSAQIGLIQVVNVTNIASRPGQTAGAPLDWTHDGAGQEAGRQDLMTTGLDGAPRGWFVDAQTAAHARGDAVGPNYIEQWGLGANNFFGWLRSPTDWHETSLYDYPASGADLDFDFETVAKATDTQNVYGAIEWGFQLRSGAVQNEYMRVFDVESATFNEALERFRGYYTHEPIVLYFDTDVDTPIAGEENKIRDVLDYLSRYPDVRINIDGYADERGTEAHNSDLAFRRARNVRTVAITLGISESRMNPEIGFGETTQFAPGALNAGTWRANRRVVMTFERTASTPIVMP